MKSEIVQELYFFDTPTSVRADISLQEALNTTPAEAWSRGDAYENRAASYARGGCPADLEWSGHLVELANFWVRLSNRLERAAREVVEQARSGNPPSGGKLSRREAIRFLAEIYNIQAEEAEEALSLDREGALARCLRAIRDRRSDAVQFWDYVWHILL
jgi:hypothetical protein